MATPRQFALKLKSQKLRLQLFPSVPEDQLWDRTTKNGFATVPRALPMILMLMNRLSPKKPISSAYLALWCRSWDDPMVTLGSKMLEISMESGFSGQRAIASLAARLAILEDLEFVKFAPGLAGEYHYGLILNPYLVLKKHKKKIDAQDWNTLMGRMSDIGANDFDPTVVINLTPPQAAAVADFTALTPAQALPTPPPPPPPPPPTGKPPLPPRVRPRPAAKQ